MPPPKSPEGQIQAAAEARRKSEFNDLAGKYVSLKEVMGFLGPQDNPVNEFARKAWERNQQNEGYTTMLQRIKLALSNKAREVFNAMGEYCRKRGRTVEETAKHLEALDAYLRMTGAITQSVKMVESPYSEHAPRRQPRAGMEILETNEAVMLSHFADALEMLKTDELLDMIVEDQKYITMLIEQHWQMGKGIGDFDPNTAEGHYELVDVDTVPVLDADGNPEKNPDETFKIKPIEKLNPANPKYLANQRALRDFILGKKENTERYPEARERSEMRKSAERVLWLNIVRNMNYEQKEDLVRAFLEPGTKQSTEEAKDFIDSCIISGVLTRDDAAKMYSRGAISRRFGPDYPEHLTAAVSARKEAKDRMAKAVRNLENPKIPSAIANFLQFDKFAVSRLIDFGFLTALINTVMDISEGLNESERGVKGRIVGFGKGILKAASDRWVLFGLGELAVGTDYVVPWIKSAVYAPSGDEREHKQMYQEAQMIRGELTGHPAMARYFASQFTALKTLAERNETNGKSKELYPGDVKISEQQAHDMGYPNAEIASAAVQRIFKICTKDLKDRNLNDSKALMAFFDQYVFSDNPRALAQKQRPNQAPLEQRKKT